MSRTCGRLWLGIAGFLGLCLSLAAQDKPATTNQGSRADSQDGALHALVEQYIAAYAKKDLSGMMALWSSQSPHRTAREKQIEGFFASIDSLSVSDIEVQRIAVEGEKAKLRVTLEVTALDVKTGKSPVGAGKSARIIECAREAGSWKIWRDADATEDLALLLLSAKNDMERSSLLEQEKELAAPALVQALIRNGQGLRTKGELDQALRAFQIARALAEQIGDARGASNALLNLGVIHNMQGDHKQAMDFFEKSLQVAESLGDQNMILTRQMNIATVYASQLEFPKALELFKKCLAIAENLGNKNLQFSIYMNMAHIDRIRGRNESAVEMYLKALDIFHSEGFHPTGGDNSGAASAFEGIATVYLGQQNNSLAMEYFQKCLTALGPEGEKATLRNALTGIGHLYQMQGDLPQALSYFQKAFELSEKMGDKAGIAGSLEGMGSVERERGHYEAAIAYFQKSMPIAESLGEKGNSASLWLDIATVQDMQGRPSDAAETLKNALSLAESSEIQDHLAAILIAAAAVTNERKNFADALPLAQRAWEMGTRMGSLDRIWEAKENEGVAYQGLGQGEQALKSFQESIVAVEQLRNQVAGSEEQRQGILSERLTPYFDMVELLEAQNRSSEAFAYAERAKGRVLLDVLQGGRVSVSKAMTADEKDREQQIQAELVSLNRQVEQENAQKPSDTTHLEELKRRRDSARLQYNDFLNSLYVVHPELRTQRGQTQPITVEEAARLLPDSKTAFLEFVTCQEKTYLFVLTRTGAENQGSPLLKVYTIQIKRRELGQQAEAFRKELGQRDLTFRRVSHELFDLLLRPAQPQLAGRNALIIVPDGPLWNLPFQAVLQDNSRYLLEDYAVAYAPSLTVLHEMMRSHHRNEPKSVAPSSTLLAMADPVLGKETLTRTAVTYRDEALGPLPEADREVKALRLLYGGEQSEIYIGAEAREDRFKTEAGRFRVLHLATHGVFDDSSPMYSNVLLASDEGGREDGILEAWEIMQMDLKADLVVLSACETARGRVSAGEGVIGLTWAFFVAGVPTTVVSQWKVESASTAKLMLGFHRTLKARESRVNSAFATARALQHAELQLLHDPQYSHPFYWAGFVVMGDPR